MTTIAYRNGVMACDSQMTDEENIRTICENKIVRIHGVLIGCSGDADARPVHEFFKKKKIKTVKQLLKKAPALNGEWTSLIAFPDGTLIMMDTNENGSCIEMLSEEPFYAVGNGGKFARAAMKGHPDVTAARAVEVACELDIHSCLPVKTMDISEDL